MEPYQNDDEIDDDDAGLPRYRAMRTGSALLEVVAWTFAVLGGLGAVILIIAGAARHSLPAVLGGVGVVVVTFLVTLTVLIYAEFLRVIVDIEGNTRRMGTRTRVDELGHV